jgi:hypothetical protein
MGLNHYIVCEKIKLVDVGFLIKHKIKRMKQFSLLLFCVFSISSFSQEAEWFEIGTTWTYNSRVALDFFDEEHQTTFVVSEEVVFNERLCKKIERLGPENNSLYGCSSLLPPFYVYESNDSVFFANDYDNTFRLAYDFGAEIGDTWVFDVPVEVFEGLTSYEVTVSDIQMEEIDGQALKVLTLDYEVISGDEYSAIGHSSLEITEYLGTIDKDFLFPFGNWNVCDGAWDIELQCFNNSSIDYLNQSFASCFLSADGILAEESIVIYPNPSLGVVSWDKPIDGLQIYDNLGKLVLQRNQIGDTSSLSLEALDVGFYTVVIDREGRLFSQKLLIQ